MKKLIYVTSAIILAGILSLSFGALQPALAQQFQLESPIEHETFGDLIDAIIKFVFNIALVLAPLFIIIGGFYFVAAAGDPSKIETGKKIIFYTLIGFLIILLSRGLVVIIKDLIKVVE